MWRTIGTLLHTNLTPAHQHTQFHHSTQKQDYSFKGDAQKLACSYAALAKSVKPGNQSLVADGSLVLTVLNTDEALGEVACRIENNASIGERKNMNLPGVVVDLYVAMIPRYLLMMVCRSHHD